MGVGGRVTSQSTQPDPLKSSCRFPSAQKAAPSPSPSHLTLSGGFLNSGSFLRQRKGTLLASYKAFCLDPGGRREELFDIQASFCVVFLVNS